MTNFVELITINGTAEIINISTVQRIGVVFDSNKNENIYTIWQQGLPHLIISEYYFTNLLKGKLGLV